LVPPSCGSFATGSAKSSPNAAKPIELNRAIREVVSGLRSS
jgi:hypothetical protein